MTFLLRYVIPFLPSAPGTRYTLNVSFIMVFVDHLLWWCIMLLRWVAASQNAGISARHKSFVQVWRIFSSVEFMGGDASLRGGRLRGGRSNGRTPRSRCLRAPLVRTPCEGGTYRSRLTQGHRRAALRKHSAGGQLLCCP